MSQYVNSDQNFLALDGDAFRAPVGTTIADASALTALAAPWLPYGAVEGGFSIPTAQDREPRFVWNKRGAAYRILTNNEIKTVTFKAPDRSAATVKTMQRGGTITETATASGIFKWSDNPTGKDEFALAIDVRDGTKHLRYLFPRVEMEGVPTENHDGTDLGPEFTLTVLTPATGDTYYKWSNFNPSVTV